MLADLRRRDLPGRIVGFLRAARFADPPQSQVVVFDREGAGIIERMVLSGTPHAIFDARGEVYYLSPRVLRRAAKSIGSVKAALRPGELPPGLRGIREVIWRAYLLACLEIMRPVVVITFIDNSVAFQWTSRNVPGVTFIAVQNGSRLRPSVHDWLPKRPRAGSVISMPHFFCFSLFEPELYAQFGHDVDSFHVVGSIRADYYRSTIAPQRVSRGAYDLCIVSEWEASLFRPDTPFQKVAAGLSQLYRDIARFIADNRLAVAVALRSQDPGEAAFFKQLLGVRAELIPSNMAEMSTYAAMDDSRVIVALNSTAAREAFGWGHAVLFCNFTGDDAYGPPRADPLWLVENEGYSVFASSLSRLLNMRGAEFAERTRSVAPYMMRHDPRHPAHEAVAAMVRASIARSVK